MYELRKTTVCDPHSNRNASSHSRLGERQKQHMQALETLLTAQNHLTHDESTLIKSGCSPSNPGAMTAISPSQDTRGSLSRHDPSSQSEALALIARYAARTNESIRARVESGEITIGDILQAGLNELDRQSTPTSLAHAEIPSNLSWVPGPRTDKILVPSNRMQVHHHSLPDIYANNFRWKQFSTVAAIRANAESIGLTFEEITHPKSISPFYSSTLAKDQSQVISIRSTGFQGIKPHLRPTETQLNCFHHPWLDIFPCPIFRDRYIHLVTMGPSVFNADEFCMDLQNGGLICWGSQSGEKHDASGSGAPWDMRSWEAQPWFLKKWWFVLGGEEGGFFQQSRWWHESRGDQLPYFW
ncbi:hypothetical protein N7533_007433 [Penicillium manginii]|uniref:uncharacterized protein n=1 Tax=Penicillium manginii TaxID=203109 RepID=UPI002546CE93|nr:uncharacterized protein N7533_007433 [Penicillium manginii]KAJ5750405.1 hypothetical protein N7533_007433 [Penicillium manginii]